VEVLGFTRDDLEVIESLIEEDDLVVQKAIDLIYRLRDEVVELRKELEALRTSLKS
jgi:hypothetical protein